jgi:cytochrome c biogenesis protein CcdA
LALVVGEGTGRPPAVGRALAATAAMTVGFLLVFGAFGLLTVEVASKVQRYLPYLTVVIGVVLVVVGVWFLIGRQLAVFVPNPLADRGRWVPTARVGSMLGYGVSYAIASLSCTVGPFLAVTGAGVRSGPVLQTVWIYLAYAAGFALVVGALAVAAAFASSALTDRIRAIVPFVNRISGGLLVVVGAYIGYYGVYELRLLGRNSNPADPVILAAGRVQGALAGWVYRHGAWPWLVVLVLLMLGALAWIWRARARRASTKLTSKEEPC